MAYIHSSASFYMLRISCRGHQAGLLPVCRGWGGRRLVAGATAVFSGVFFRRGDCLLRRALRDCSSALRACAVGGRLGREKFPATEKRIKNGWAGDGWWAAACMRITHSLLVQQIRCETAARRNL